MQPSYFLIQNTSYHTEQRTYQSTLSYYVFTPIIILLSSLEGPLEAPLRAEERPFPFDSETKFSWVNKNKPSPL